MDEFHLRNKIHEIRSYIASDWPGVEDRKRLYETLRELEARLKEMRDETQNKQEEDRKA
jgi:hypothetical protein